MIYQMTALKLKRLLVTTAAALAAGTPAGLADADTGNELAVGNAAKAPGTLAIKVNPVADFNYKTRADILAMRKREIDKYPQLINGSYTARNAVFAAIEDGKPWWGLAGSAVFGSGNRSIEGPSEESRFVMNPYMLVGANPGCLYMWDEHKITAQDIANPDFPYFWMPESIRFSPKSSVGTVTYNISKFQQQIVKTGKLKNQSTFTTAFSLVAYNAKDFGFNYIWLDPHRSVNVKNDNRTNSAVAIRQFIHCGGTCGYPGNCNNMSPFIKEIDRIHFTQLPARAVVALWKEEPVGVSSKPDMYFLLEFK